MRMNRAAQLLSQTRLSIKEIGLHVGINPPGAFSRVFRAWYGVTPNEFRVRWQQKLWRERQEL